MFYETPFNNSIEILGGDGRTHNDAIEKPEAWKII